MSTFGEKLKWIRKSQGISQEEIARRLHTSKQAVSRYERNQRAPKITVAKAYAVQLGVPLEYLIDDSVSVMQIDVRLHNSGNSPESPFEKLDEWDYKAVCLFRTLSEKYKKIAVAQLAVLADAVKHEEEAETR